MKCRSLLFLVSAIGSCFTLTPKGEENPAPFAGKSNLTVLVFGASWSHGIIKDFPLIAAAAGKKVEVRCLRAAGFKKYWEAVQMADTSPEDPKSWVALETDYKARVRIKDELLSKSWDVIALQRHSLSDKDSNEAAETARQLIAYIRQQSPQAKLVIYQTHAYRGDSDLLQQVVPKGWDSSRPFTSQDSLEVTRSICQRVARENQALLIPVGDAFDRIRRDPVFGWTFPDPAFDYKNPERKGVPATEKNSLMIGFRWLPPGKTGIDGRIHQADDHPNNLGRYLYGLVFFESLFGETVIGNTYFPNGPTLKPQLEGAVLEIRADKVVTPERISFLQKAAHETVQGGRNPKGD